MFKGIMTHTLIKQCIYSFKPLNKSFYRHILAIWEIVKENNNKSRNFAFICSAINVSLNLTFIETYDQYTKSVKKFSYFFIFIL